MNAVREVLQLQAPLLQEQIRARPLLGTVVEIAATGAAEDVQQAISQAFDAVAEVHALMSYQDPASELSRINQTAFDAPVAVHDHTWQVLSAARELSEASNGLFDVTIAPALTRQRPTEPGATGIKRGGECARCCQEANRGGEIPNRQYNIPEYLAGVGNSGSNA